MKPPISFLSKKREAITTDFANWYQNEVFLKLNPSLNRDSWSDNWKIVEHVQEALRRVFISSDTMILISVTDIPKLSTCFVTNINVVNIISLKTSLRCCGFEGASDFQELSMLTANDAQKLRMTCVQETVSSKGDNSIQRPEFFEAGCHEKLISQADGYIVFVWIVSPFVLLLQLVSLVTTVLFVIYLIKGGKYDDEDEDCSGSFSNNSRSYY